MVIPAWWNYSLSVVHSWTSETRYSRCYDSSDHDIIYGSAILCIQEGKTALAWASWKGHKQTVDVLLSAGAKPDIQDQVTECVVILMLMLITCTLLTCTGRTHFMVIYTMKADLNMV